MTPGPPETPEPQTGGPEGRAAVLSAFGRWLRAAGYSRAYTAALGLDGWGASPFAPSVSALVERCPSGWAPEVWSLLAAGEEVAARRLPAGLQALLPGLCAQGWLRARAGGRVAGAGQVVVGCHDLVLLGDTPMHYGAVAEPEVYLGPDSLWLATWIPAMPKGGLTWDLGCGSGLHGLRAARGGGRAVLTDVGPRCLRTALANAELNGLADRVEVIGGDLHAPVAGRRFDLIAALPPYVPDVPGVPLPGFASGGPDGAAFLRRILRVLPETLAAGGVFVAFAYLLAGPGGPLLLRDGPAVDLVLRVEAASSLDAASFADALAQRLAGRLPARTVRDACAAHFRRIGATGAQGALIRAWRRDAPPAPPGPLAKR